MFLIHIQCIINFQMDIILFFLQFQTGCCNPHLKCSKRCRIKCHIFLTLFENHMYIYLPLLADFHTLRRHLDIVDRRFSRIVHHFFITKIMTSISIIILSRDNDLDWFLFLFRIHHLKSAYMYKYIFFHISLLILIIINIFQYQFS